MKKIPLILFSLSLLNATSLKTMLENIDNNDLFKAKNYETLSKEENAKSVKLKYLPSLSLQGNYLRFDKDKYIISPDSVLSASLVVDALVYDGKRNQNIKLAKKDYELNKVELEKMKNELAFNLTSLYYSYLALEENIEYKNQNINYLNAALNRLEKLESVGLKPKDELEIFRAKVELTKSELNDLNYQKDEILSNIYLLTNNHFEPTKGSAVLEEDEINNSYDVKISSIKEEMSEINKDLSLADFKPTIYLKNITSISNNKFDYSRFYPFSDLVNDKLKEKMTSNVFLAGFDWNIFAFGASKKGFESAKLSNLAAKQMNIYNKKLSSEKERLLKEKINNLAKDLKANENRLKASKIAYESIAKKYEAGLVGYVEYLNALELQQAAKAMLSLSRAKFEISKAELLLAKGIDIKKYIIDL